jgi:hypothetical protein
MISDQAAMRAYEKCKSRTQPTHFDVRLFGVVRTSTRCVSVETVLGRAIDKGQ